MSTNYVRGNCCKKSRTSTIVADSESELCMSRGAGNRPVRVCIVVDYYAAPIESPPRILDIRFDSVSSPLTPTARLLWPSGMPN